MGFRKQILSSRVIQDLKKRSFTGIFIYAIALAVVLLADGYYYRHPGWAKILLGFVSGICLFRLGLIFMGNWLWTRTKRLDLFLFFAGIWATALIWGIGFAAVMVQPQEIQTQLLMVACTIGICSGGCTAFSPNLWLSLVYNAFILWPGIIFMAFINVNWPLVMLMILFFIYMAVFSVQANYEYLTALDNEALLEQKTRDLEELSNLDGLTGIYNRRYFDTALEVAWQGAVRNKHRLALVICDIDYFKRVNDDFGHQAGDAYLKSFARHLSQVFKRQTDIAARYGGEEFVVLMDHAPPGIAVELARQFRREMEGTRLVFEGRTIHATVSVGVAELLPGPELEKEVLVARADTMLYEAKNRGRNRVEAFSA